MDTREEIAASVCQHIARTAFILRREMDRIVASTGLSGPQLVVLHQLETYGPMPLSEIGKRMWISAGMVTGLVDKLVAAGYVRRARMRKDRRIVIAGLTRKGREVMHEVCPRHDEVVMLITAGLEVTELFELQSMLERLRRPRDHEADCAEDECGGTKTCDMSGS